MPVQVKHNNDGKFYHIAIDIAKEGAQLFDLTPYVKGRVGDNGFGLIIDWYRQGLLMNVNGTYKPVIDGLVGGYSFDKNNNLKMADDASPVYSVGKPEDCGPAGQVTYYFPEQMFPKEGIFKGYLGLIDDKGNRYSGVDIWFAVLAGNARMGIACDFYISELEKAIATAEEDLRNSKKSMQTVVDEFVSKMNDLTNRLETQATTDQAALDALEAKIKQDNLFTQTEADAFKKEIEDRLKNIGIIGLNVIGYGAKGDGKTDDTDAVLEAFNDAKTSNSHHVYFPAGQYIVNTTIPLSGIVASGDDRNSSIIINDRAEPVFSLQSNSGVHDLGFKTTSTASNKMIAIEKSGGDVAYQDIDISRLAFEAPEYETDGKTAGKWGLRPFYFDLDGLGLTGVTIRDCLLKNVYGGLTVDTTNDGWMTGCLYDNITVRGFKHHVLELTSSNNTLNQLSQNVFSNFTGQVLHEANDDAAGYIIAGTGNNFDNLRLFNDGNSNWHAIKLHYCGGDKFDAHNATFSKGATAFNSFKGGDLEGVIYDPDGLRELQHFDHVQLQISGSAVGDDSVIQMVNVNDPVHTNLLSRRGFIKNTAISAQAELPSDARIIQSADSYGEFFEITMGATGGTFDYILNDPEATVSAVKQGDYTIGLRWQNLNPNIDLSKNLRAYLEFGGQDVTDHYKYIYKNPNIHSDLKEWSWIVEPDQSFYAKNINYADNNFFKIYLGPNMHIKIYAIFVCPGRVLDFERVNDDGDLNVLPLTTAKPLPVGTTLTGISHHMVRFAGTYYAGTGNHPADTPADFSNNDYMIRVTPGTANDNGILELINLNTNTILKSTVAGGNSFTWIKQHA
ncbi:glycosyl hydrolase family 28-related protein [Limosilactobacillus reuteri]|uniref:glycosyl hydrolase family 28-related protein n=1 Tax=Limosilactobacillus reuteri TaxID=1598 RepID=UPI000A2E51FC|nr:glycosyl hydrolase family 28-related protein [Limosilactobacillus reuteri]OTA50679.1 hypothetical protein BHL90_05185 [Limosilactobacillus reuteri]